ncbi:MAG: SDR family oxidoreductase [Spirochaetales bacterium]|nr:SDR family oxidoreductase [Spirochaetales bacterium]
MKHELYGKRALVFGASSGIGRALAIALGQAGARVAVSYNNNAAGAEQTMSLIPEQQRAIILKADLLKPVEVEQTVTGAVKALKGLDFAILVAAQFHMAPLTECQNNIIEEVVSRNVVAPFVFAREVLKELKRNGGGKIFFVGTSQGHRPLINTSLYAGTKGILLNLVKSICLEHGRDNIQALLLSPGVTMSAGNIENFSSDDERNNAEMIIPAGKILQPEQFADIAMRLLGEDSGYITGSEIMVDGGLLCTGAQV